MGAELLDLGTPARRAKPGAAPDVGAFTRAARRATVEAWGTVPRPTWSVGMIRQALLTHRTGDFSLAAQLFDAMLEDDELPGTLERRADATLQAPFSFAAPPGAEEDDPPDQLREWWPTIAPSDELFDLLTSRIMLGVGVGTLDWNTRGPGGLWLPSLRALPTEFLRYDETERRWQYQTTKGLVPVTPGDGKWVLFTRGQRGWIWGLIRGLATLWLGKSLTLGDWQRYCQKHGLPIIKAKVPVFTDAREKAAFVDDLSNIASEGVIGLPRDVQEGREFGYDVELLEAKDQSWETFQAKLERADRKIQIMLLGGHLGAEVASTGANRATAKVHAQALSAEKAVADRLALCKPLREQVLRPFFALNFGPDAPIPYPYWAVKPDDDARTWVDAQSTFVRLLGEARQGGYKVTNAEELARQFRLEVEETDEPPPGSAVAESPRGQARPDGGSAKEKAGG